MRCGAAAGTDVLRAMRESSRRTRGNASQPCSRARETGGDFVDGLLDVAGNWGFDGDLVRATGNCEAGCYSEWTTAGIVSMAATVAGSDRLANFGEGSGGLLHRVGFAATGSMGESVGARDGVPGAAECADRHGPRSLYVMGATAIRIGKGIRADGSGRVKRSFVTGD